MMFPSVRARHERAVRYVTGEDTDTVAAKATYLLVLRDVPMLFRVAERQAEVIRKLYDTLFDVYKDTTSLSDAEIHERLGKLINGH